MDSNGSVRLGGRLFLTVLLVLAGGHATQAASQYKGSSGSPWGKLTHRAYHGASRVPENAFVAPLNSVPTWRRSGHLAAKAGTVCDGMWQGAPATRSVGWILGQEVYMSYQDPLETGCQNAYPFTITDVFWAVQVDVPVTLRLQPVIASNLGTPTCPRPGNLLCLGQADTITLDVGSWVVQMPLNMSCSVAESYFCGVYLADSIPMYTIDLIFDADTVSPNMCRSYDDWGEGWQDLSVVFPNVILFSQGQTAAPVCACACHGDPQCDSVTDVLDVVKMVNVAFRGATAITDPNPQCPRVATDLDCNGATDVIDVVKMVNVAFRGGTHVANFCVPCP